LIERANLPLDDKKHMPPKGKTQLTPEEIAVLSAWINDGTNTQKTLKQLAVNSPIKAYWEKNKRAILPLLRFLTTLNQQMNKRARSSTLLLE
jgi:hypothetical protein